MKRIVCQFVCFSALLDSATWSLACFSAQARTEGLNLGSSASLEMASMNSDMRLQQMLSDP